MYLSTMELDTTCNSYTHISFTFSRKPGWVNDVAQQSRNKNRSCQQLQGDRTKTTPSEASTDTKPRPALLRLKPWTYAANHIAKVQTWIPVIPNTTVVATTMQNTKVWTWDIRAGVESSHKRTIKSQLFWKAGLPVKKGLQPCTRHDSPLPLFWLVEPLIVKSFFCCSPIVVFLVASIMRDKDPPGLQGLCSSGQDPPSTPRGLGALLWRQPNSCLSEGERAGSLREGIWSQSRRRYSHQLSGSLHTVLGQRVHCSKRTQWATSR